MAEMVGSAVAQEVVSGAFSFMRNNHEELASRSHLTERLNMAHLELKFALERSRKMPITDVSLLQRRMMIKHAFKECTLLLVNLQNEGVEQRVSLSPSFPKRIMHALKPFFRIGKGSMNEPCVRRFEWYAKKAGKFVRDVESGCSLGRYRFSSSLITQLLQGKNMYYGVVSASQTRTLSIHSSFLEDYGAVAYLIFGFKDVKTPMKCFRLDLMLRISESTDIVGISTTCLQSLEQRFKPVANVASGELAQISTQVDFLEPNPAIRERMFNLATMVSRWFRQEPLCCIGDGFLQPSAKNSTLLSSKSTERFSEQVSYVRFECFIPDAGNLESSAVETNRSIIKTWPILPLTVVFLPHFLRKTEDDKIRTYALTSRGEIPLDCTDLSMMPMLVPVLALHLFKLEPERTDFTIAWCAPHGFAFFTVSKATTETGNIGGTPKIQKTSKRKR